MGTTMLVACSVITAAQAMYIFHSFGSHYLKVAFGYKAVVDVVMSLGLTIFFATTGAFSAMLMSSITGLCLSTILYVGRKTYGYRKYENKQWVEYNPEWDVSTTVNSFKDKAISMKDKVVSTVNGVV